MGFAHFTDIIRLALLYNYGGVWIDATILLTDYLPQEYFEMDYFMFQRDDNLENKKSRSGGGENVVPAIKQIKREIAIQEQVYEQLKVQYELLKVIIASENPAFQILAMPEIPERKSNPPRTKIYIIAFVAGLFFSIFLAFLLNALQEIWRDPSVRAKFLSKREKHRES